MALQSIGEVMDATYGNGFHEKLADLKAKVEIDKALNPDPPKQNEFPDGRRFGREGRGAWIYSHYPARFARAIDNTNYTDIQKKVLEKIVKEQKSGIIIGANGTGKTLLMYQAEVELMSKDIGAMDVKAISLFDRIRGWMAEHKDVLDHIHEMWTDDRVLFIDEVDKAYGTPTEYIYFNELVDERYADMEQTVIIGNFKSWDECIAKIGQSAFDRLTNSTDGFKANLTGMSFRQGS